jgi:hypothetical protein
MGMVILYLVFGGGGIGGFVDSRIGGFGDLEEIAWMDVVLHGCRPTATEMV